MLCKYAHANALNTSGAHNEFPKWDRQPKAAGPIRGGAAGGRPHHALREYQKHWPPYVLKALATRSFKSIGHPHIVKAASHYLF
jgi:hypothetical protein